MWDVSTGSSTPETSMTTSGENNFVSRFIRKLKYLERKNTEKTMTEHILYTFLDFSNFLNKICNFVK